MLTRKEVHFKKVVIRILVVVTRVQVKQPLIVQEINNLNTVR